MWEDEIMHKKKFRVWDKEFQEFSNWTNRDPFLDLSSGKIFYCERTRSPNGSYGGDIVIEDNGERFVLQEWTGVQDKHGNDIYEGDILKIHNCNCLENVVFLRGSFGIHQNSKHSTRRKDNDEADFYGLDTFYSHELEVLGNIFQNTGLLL
jgi:uncharacterized phage protein (TIGR01671 family)